MDAPEDLEGGRGTHVWNSLWESICAMDPSSRCLQNESSCQAFLLALAYKPYEIPELSQTGLPNAFRSIQWGEL